MRFRVPVWGYRGGVCACNLPLGVWAQAGAATIDVPAGGDLQGALNAAQPGDVIALAPGATYVGNFVLPKKGATAAPSRCDPRRPTRAAAGRRAHDARVRRAAAEDQVVEQRRRCGRQPARTTGR